MKVSTALFLWVLALPLGAPSLSQPLTQRVENGRRVCVYQGLPGLRSGDESAPTAYVDPTQNCPATMPPRPGVGSPPGTAQLYETGVENGRRLCIYVQGGERWTRTVAIDRDCPMAAGMLASESNERPPGQGTRRSRRAPTE